MIVQYEREHLPTLVLCYFAGDFPTTDLFIECVKQLLPGRSSRECSAMMERPAKPAKVHQPFFGPREWHAHPVKQIDDLGRHIGHPFDRGLIG